MLVLTVKLQEGVWIEGDIVVRILKAKGNTFRVGIDAPGQKVLREKLLDGVKLVKDLPPDEAAA